MKLVLKIVAVVVVLVIASVIAAFVWIDQVAKAGVEGGATYALGVDTKLDSMSVGVFSGRVAMTDLRVSNPPGFESPHFMRVDQGGIAVTLGTLMQDKVVLPELTLSGLRLNPIHHQGQANYKTIIDNLKKFESKEGSAAEPGPSRQGKRFVIEKVSIRDVQVEVELLPVGGSLTKVPVVIERLELENVGSDSEKGVLLAELTDVILKGILTAVLNQAGHVLPADIAGELTAGLGRLKGLGDVSVQVVGEVTAVVVEQVGAVTEKLAKGAGKVVEDTAHEIDQELEKSSKELEKGVKDLLEIGKKTDGK